VLFHSKAVNQPKNNDICINFMGRTKTKPFLKRKILLSLWAAKKVSSLLLEFSLVEIKKSKYNFSKIGKQQ
jgi:hypothetical protein